MRVLLYLPIIFYFGSSIPNALSQFHKVEFSSNLSYAVYSKDNHFLSTGHNLYVRLKCKSAITLGIQVGAAYALPLPDMFRSSESSLAGTRSISSYLSGFIHFNILDSCFSLLPTLQYVHMERNNAQKHLEENSFFGGLGIQMRLFNAPIRFFYFKKLKKTEAGLLSKDAYLFDLQFRNTFSRINLSTYLGSILSPLNSNLSPYRSFEKYNLNRLEGGLIFDFYPQNKGWFYLTSSILTSFQQVISYDRLPDRSKVFNVSEDVSWTSGICITPFKIHLTDSNASKFKKWITKTQFEIGSVYATQRICLKTYGPYQLNSVSGFYSSINFFIPKVFNDRFFLICRFRYIPDYYHSSIVTLVNELGTFISKDQWNFSIGGKVMILRGNK